MAADLLLLFRPRLAALLAGLGLAALALAAERTPSDPGQFRYEPLPASGTVEVRIDGSTPVFEFKPGRSAFRAFRLPAGNQRYLLEIRSLLTGGTDADRGRVFYPVAALLDDNFLVSRQTELESLHFDLPVFEDAAAPAYRLTIGVDPAQGRERYLVIYTPAALLAPRPTPAVATAVTTPEVAAEATHLSYAGAAGGGVLRVTVRPEGIAR